MAKSPEKKSEAKEPDTGKTVRDKVMRDSNGLPYSLAVDTPDMRVWNRTGKNPFSEEEGFAEQLNALFRLPNRPSSESKEA